MFGRQEPAESGRARAEPQREATAQLAANLRSTRSRAGLTQERLASVCRLHRTEISLLERGEREPRLTTIVRLAHGLGVSPAALLADLD